MTIFSFLILVVLLLNLIIGDKIDFFDLSIMIFPFSLFVQLCLKFVIEIKNLKNSFFNLLGILCSGYLFSIMAVFIELKLITFIHLLLFYSLCLLIIFKIKNKECYEKN